MQNIQSYTILEAANNLAVSEAVINKFINRGLIMVRQKAGAKILTPYAYRQLVRILDLYEKSYPADGIERLINN